MAPTSFLKTKCEIVPENSYRIIHSLSLRSVIEKAIYSLPKRKNAQREIYGSHTGRRGDGRKKRFVAHAAILLESYNGTIQSQQNS